MTFEQIIADLEKKIFKPVYYLIGEEAYYIDEISNYISDNVLNEAEKSFNQTVLYGKDTDINTILGIAKRFPMMSNQQVIIVKEAQNIKDIDGKSNLKEGEIDPLMHYVQNPLKSTILVICCKYKKIDGRKKIFKVLKDSAVLFESKKIYDNEVPTWISTFLNKKGISIDPVGSMMLSEYLGNDLSKIANELTKLIITIPENVKKITPDQIEKNIGISKEYNNFELQNALFKKDILKANRIINYFCVNQKNNPVNVTITSLYFAFSKILLYHGVADKTNNRDIASALQVNPYFINDYKIAAKNYPLSKTIKVISILREFDMRSKGVDCNDTSPETILKEMIFRILH